MEGDDAAQAVTPLAAYPAWFEADVVLADGATAHVRPIRPDDGARILEFHGRQSPQSIYFRYFSPRPRLTERDVERMTDLDYVDRMALVALRGDALIGVARYDRRRYRSEAEVAFFVDDANHGRGLATLLLEHLAVRAREVGLTGFTASVLPDNRKMIAVFTAAGFETATRFADGIVEVRLGITPTPEAEAAIERRARAASSQAVRRLLAPRSVAVIGASREAGSVGHEVLRNLQRSHFQGPVYPVNPAAEHVASIRAVPSILDVPDEVDLAVIALPAPLVPAAVEECGRKQVYGVVVLSSGFAESGPDGVALEAELLRVARSWGIRVVGPNSLGILNTDPDVGLLATFAHVNPLAGPVSLLSESGMVGAVIVATARAEGIGISSMVALGNRADVSGNDLLQYWESDPATRVVCMYIESFGNARRFSRLARRLTRAKPVVAVKATWSRGGDRPAIHSWASSTDDVLLRQTGVIRVPTLPDLLDTARLLVQQPLPAGSRVAVVGNAGGSLAIAADAVAAAGLEVASLADATRTALAQVVPTAVEVGDLVDLGLRADAVSFSATVELLAADPGVDALVVLYAPSLGGTASEVREALDSAAVDHPDHTIVACFYGGVPDADASDHRVPVYDAVDRATRSLGRVAEYAGWLREDPGEPLELGEPVARRAREIVAAALDRDERTLRLTEAIDVLTVAGVSVVETGSAGSLDEALESAEALGYPVALKAAGRDHMAKTVAAGLALDLPDESTLRGAWARMAERFGDRLVPALVQPMVEPGVDVAVAVEAHPEVGPVISLRPGGANAALDQDAEVRVLPLGADEAHRMVEDSRMAPYLEPAARAALRDLLLRVGALVEDVPEIVGLQANPVIVGEQEAVAIDVHLEVARVIGDEPPPVRTV